jgi:hypothetical protein
VSDGQRDCDRQCDRDGQRDCDQHRNAS